MSAYFPIPHIHRAGWPIIAAFVAGAAILSLLGGFFACLGLILTAWCVWFFRDPVRVTPSRAGLVVSPADGRVIAVADAVPPTELEMGDTPRQRVTVFLSVFDVHVNRIAIDGVIAKKVYHAGKFLHAAADKASTDNERLALKIELGDGRGDLAQVQIAGYIARRIVCDVAEGDRVAAGQRYGLIRFGSRADIYLPHGAQSLVCVGQTVLGGETVLADLASQEVKRTGVAQ